MVRAKIDDAETVSKNNESIEKKKFRVSFVNTHVGYGVFTKTAISKGELLLEYRGPLNLASESDIPDTTYTYFFEHNGKEYCIDATNNMSIGRFVNDLDWKTKTNCKIRKVIVDGVPRLAVFALKDIAIGSELRYDYGCRDAPWRKRQKNTANQIYKEPEFLHAFPEIIVISKSGEDSEKLKMVNPICLIGSARNCCVIVSKPGVKDVHIQLELCNGELFLTDFCDQKERRIGIGETFSVLDRQFRIEISKEESGVGTVKPDNTEAELSESNGVCPVDESGVGTVKPDNTEAELSESNDVCPVDESGVGTVNPGNTEAELSESNSVCPVDESGVGTVEPDNTEAELSESNGVCPVDESGVGTIEPDNTEAELSESNGSMDESGVGTVEPDSTEAELSESNGSMDDDSIGDPDYCETSSVSSAEDDVNTEKTSDTDFSDVVCPVPDGSILHPDNRLSTQKGDAAGSMEEMSEIIEPSCEEIEKPLFPQLIVVDKVERNTKGSLSNKKHCCAFCEKLYPNIARHLSLKHKNEIAVGKILALPKQSKERRKMWDELVKKGDFAYNYDILTTGKGTLIPKYRARDAETTIKNVLPCQYCRGMYRRKELWRHQKSCKSRVASPGYETGPIAGGKKLLPVTCSDKAFHDNIILNIKEDEVKLAILSDQTILDFGLNLYNDQGHQQHKHVYISQKMRELGRLNIAGKKNNLMSIEECMKKENWDLLILSVKEVSEFNPETKNFGIPSLALKLGHSLKTCADDIYFKALKVGDTVKQEVANTFLEIYKLRWNKEISGKALTTLDTIKYNRPKLLPLVEDVAKLNNYIKEKCEHVSSESQSSDVYREFCQLCLAQIIVFNRKRSGEAERMTVSQFKKAKVGGIIDPVIMSTLTEFEQTLCKSYLRVEIAGKKGRKVPVLLTNAMQKNLNMLVTLRSQLNIRDDFMFARPGNTRFPFRGVDCLRNIVNQAGLKFPEIITSTSLRKQLATMAQVLNLNDTSQDLLAAFEGHDIRIHRQFYRLPEETMQVAKVSRLLHCLNNGTIGKYSGCNFDDIEFEIDADVEAEVSDDIEAENDIEIEDDVEVEDNTSDDECTNDVLGYEAVQEHTIRKKRKQNHSTDVSHKTDKRAKTSEKHVWTSAEKIALEQQFAKNIRLEKVPGKLECLNVQRKCSVLCALPWKKIKFAVYNQIKLRKNRINKMHA